MYREAQSANVCDLDVLKLIESKSSRFVPQYSKYTNACRDY